MHYATRLGRDLHVELVCSDGLSTPAASDAEFPLIERCTDKGYHAWGYGGTDGQAHITHIRYRADVCDALDGKTPGE